MNQKEFNLLADLFARRKVQVMKAKQGSAVPEAWDVATIIVDSLQQELAELLAKEYKSFDPYMFEARAALVPSEDSETLADMLK